MFADAYENYGKSLAENATVLVQGNIIVNQEGARVNVKECYPLDGQVAGIIKKVTWLLKPAHPETPAFLERLRETITKQSGSTNIELAFVFENRTASVAEVSSALSWKRRDARARWRSTSRSNRRARSAAIWSGSGSPWQRVAEFTYRFCIATSARRRSCHAPKRSRFCGRSSPTKR
jgi:hypothetical protein